MIRKIYLGVIVLAIVLGCADQSQKSGDESKKIISLSPATTEILYAIGAGKQIVGVTDYCLFPEEAGLVTKIGGLIDPNVEKIVSLQPDLIFGVPAHNNLNQQLKSFDLNVIMLPNENVGQVVSAIDTIGQITGRQQAAQNLIYDIKDRLSKVKIDGLQSEAVKAVLIIGREKGTLRNIMVAGPGTFLDEMWTLAGGENVYADMTQRYTMITTESLIHRKPDVIIEFDTEQEHAVHSGFPKEWTELYEESRPYHFTVSGSHVLIPGPRMVLLAEDFQKVIKQIKQKPDSNNGQTDPGM